MNPSMALCQSLDATLATTRLWLHRTQFHDVPRPQAYAFAYLDDRLRKSKNNYFYCRWQDSGTMELDGTGSCLDVLPRARHLHLCLKIMRKMQNRTQKISTAKISVLLTLYWPELKNPGFAPIFGQKCELTGPQRYRYVSVLRLLRLRNTMSSPWSPEHSNPISQEHEENGQKKRHRASRPSPWMSRGPKGSKGLCYVCCDMLCHNGLFLDRVHQNIPKLHG